MYSLHRIVVSLSVILFTLNAFAGNPYLHPAGAGEAGMGSVCVMKSGFWPSFRNQALLAYNTSYIAGFNYENRFNIIELGTRTAGFTMPAGKASLGLVYSHFGYSEFRRSMFGLACGLPVSKKIAAGVQVDYFHAKASGDYDSDNSLTFEAGLFLRLTGNVSAGIHLFNPVPGSLRKTVIPSSVRAGAGIQLSKVLFAGAEAEMSTAQKLIVRTGFDFEAVKNLWLRGGFSSENSSFTFGLGYLIRSLKIDLSFATHEKLGITSSASLIFKIK